MQIVKNKTNVAQGTPYAHFDPMGIVIFRVFSEGHFDFFSQRSHIFELDSKAVEAPKPQAVPQQPKAPEVKSEPVPVAPVEPVAPANRDDLTAINGIGPKTQDKLYAAGIETYAEIAAMDPEALAEIETISVREAEQHIADAKAITDPVKVDVVSKPKPKK